MSKPEILSFLKEEFLMPQPEVLELSNKSQLLFIGIPKERAFQEKRVPLVPEAVGLLVSNGHKVYLEKGAGMASFFTDKEYSDAGAKICLNVKEVYYADIILKVLPPSIEELDYLKHNQCLISALQLKTRTSDYFKKLMEKKVTAVAFDYIQDETKAFSIVQSMSEIAGNSSILIASELLNTTAGGKGMLMGGIPGVSPTQVVIIGAGTVAEYASRTAIALGASVKVFDNSIARLRRLQNDIHLPVATSILQPKVLEKALRRADVAIGALRAMDGRTPCVISDEMVKMMKPKSVIVDVSIDQGGCFETSEVTSHETPIFTKYDVIHYCVPNIASRVSKTASFSLSNILAPLLLEVGNGGGVKGMLLRSTNIRGGVYVYNGILTNKGIGQWFDLPSKEIKLLLGH
ncbi:MAG: alanine dehydrogenase [Flavobacteriales bacterium]|nr:alanine dehydrogenase [Flavobacteriales bacterium]|tara:strand:- start:6666 stop:7877 length:1212 start_codon:yes stop_codon:yes gene_type:complete